MAAASPAAAAGLTDAVAVYDADGQLQTLQDIIWAVAPADGSTAWLPVREEAGLDFLFASIHGARQAASRVPPGLPDPASFSTLAVRLLVSRVEGSVHDNDYRVLHVSLVRRGDHYATHGVPANARLLSCQRRAGARLRVLEATCRSVLLSDKSN